MALIQLLVGRWYLLKHIKKRAKLHQGFFERRFKKVQLTVITTYISPPSLAREKTVFFNNKIELLNAAANAVEKNVIMLDFSSACNYFTRTYVGMLLPNKNLKFC